MSAVGRAAHELSVHDDTHVCLTLAHLKALVHMAEAAGMPDGARVLNGERKAQRAIILRDGA